MKIIRKSRIWLRKKESTYSVFVRLSCSSGLILPAEALCEVEEKEIITIMCTHVLWKRWGRRLSTNQRYFIALRHYSFSWHIMFLIKIACELIKMFIRVLFFFFLLLLPWPCFSSTFMLKLSSILIPLLLLATNLAHRFYIKLAKTNKLNWKPLILKWPQKTEDGGGERPASLTLKPKLMQLASSKSIY